MPPQQEIGEGGGGGIAGRGGSSPIGTTSPNTGGAGNTASSYGIGAFASGVNIQGDATDYVVQATDYQGLIVFDTGSPVAVTLNYAVGSNFTTTILNIGSGAITLTPIAPPPDSVSPLYTVNGATSLTLPSGAGCIVAFAASLWYAYVGATFIPVVPATFNAVTNEWLTSYNALTGAFAASQPAFSNISGNLATSQLPAAGISATVALAQLTTLGAPGSATFQNGLLTAYVAPS